MSDRKIPELLAPVGGWQQLKAAVQNGADAVYMGGSLFNARIKAENFTNDDMKAAIAYAHERNVNVYVTINTLIKDSELMRAFSYVDFLYGAGADAVILQDMGLARLVRKYIPGMPMHLSTQGTIYNEMASEIIKEMGFCRVVPARELSLEEIRRLCIACHKEKCEVEIFVHGALCMCYSGQCQMSRVIGGVNGRSGNRGLCAQPCRLPYADENGKERFLLSPKDICTIDMLSDICRAGVDSLKIEGRLKSPQYVAIITSIYRKYLDMYKDEGIIRVKEEDRQKLLQIFNRGGFSQGYLNGNPGDKLLSGESPKNQGLYAGKVVGSRKGSTLVDVRTEENELSMGDGVEIYGRRHTGNVISYIKPLNDGTVRIGDIKGKVSIGDKVYKVTDKQLNVEAERSYENDFHKKIPVRMIFKARLGKHPELVMEEADKEKTLSVSVTDDIIVEAAINKTLEEKRIREQLMKLGETVFEAEYIDICIDEGISLPISVLNGMRRQAAEKMRHERAMRFNVHRRLTEEEMSDILEKESLGDETLLERNADGKNSVYIYSRESLERFLDGDHRMCCKTGNVFIPLELYMRDDIRRKLRNKAEIRFVPYILNISKGNLDDYIEENFERIVESVKPSGIMVGNLGWIKSFVKAGVKVYGDYGLNVYNGQSLKAMEDIGIEVRAYSHEADKYQSGDIPLMITEHPVTARMFTDRKGAAYRVMKWHSNDKYLIFREGYSEKNRGKFIHYIR